MEPIDHYEGTRTFKVSEGPGTHQISSCICPASDGHFMEGVKFMVHILGKDDRRIVVRDEIFPFLLAELKLLDVCNKNVRLTCGAYFKEIDFLGWMPLKKAPFQITNYSTQTRKGHMEMSYTSYLYLFDSLK